MLICTAPPWPLPLPLLLRNPPAYEAMGASVTMPIPSQPSSAAHSRRITLEPLSPDASRPDGPELLTRV